MIKVPHAARLLMLAVLAIGAGFWWWSSRGACASIESGPQATAPRSDVATPPTGDNAAIRQAALASTPLPPGNLPLRDRVASLQSRADAGDSLAACRFGMDLLRCAALTGYHAEHDAFMERQEAELEAKGELTTAKRISAGRLLHAQLREACAGVPDALVDRAHHYVRQAALAGEPEAMIRYAHGETLMRRGPSLAFIKSPEFDAWRNEARPVLMRALESGHPEAVLILAKAHAGNDSHLTMLLPRDATEANASLSLAQRLFGDDPALARGLFGNQPTSQQALDEHEAATAERMAADWHSRHFNGRSLVLADHTAALLPLHRRLEWEDGSSGWPGQPRAETCSPATAEMP